MLIPAGNHIGMLDHEARSWAAEQHGMAYVEHPGIMIAIALLWSPVLFPLARFFFQDLKTFLHDIGWRETDDIWWKAIRLGWFTNPYFAFKAVGFVGTFAILVGLTYVSVVKMLYQRLSP